MSKVAHYLQEHLVGEVISSAEARKYFSTDGGVFSVTPGLIVYPKGENDVRKAARFTWQLAERGKVIPITARGLGTDQSGAAIGSGIIMVFPAHMNRILEFDGKTGVTAVEPGINFGKLQQTLHTHGRFLPPFPASIEYCTIGGAVANNAGGEKSVKYGTTKDFVKGLRVVLANGEVIETKRLSKRELSKKLGLATFEGEVYRALDTLIEENREAVQNLGNRSSLVTKNSSGYDLSSVKRKDGSFDLTPLFVGSQGTLGIVTEITLDTKPHNPNTTLIAAFLDDLGVAQEVVAELKKLPDSPSAMEMVDENVLLMIDKQNPNLLKGVIDKPFSKLVLLVEFDNDNNRVQKRLSKKTTKILEKFEVPYRVETEEAEQEQLWKLRHSAATVVANTDDTRKALPIIEDGIVPPDKFQEYIEKVYALFASYRLPVALWGHAGDANLHLQPFLDLGEVGDRQRVFRLMDEYYKLVLELGGTTSGEHNDGRLRGPYLRQTYGDEIYGLFQRVKQILDPYGTLNPGVKIGVEIEDIKPLLRNEFSISNFYDHLPRI